MALKWEYAWCVLERAGKPELTNSSGESEGRIVAAEVEVVEGRWWSCNIFEAIGMVGAFILNGMGSHSSPWVILAALLSNVVKQTFPLLAIVFVDSQPGAFQKLTPTWAFASRIEAITH